MFEEVAEGAKRIAGRVVVGGALGIAALVPLTASAQDQRLAANGTVPQQVSISAECAPIRDIAQQTACEIQRRREAELTKIRAVTQAANSDSECSVRIKAMLADGKIDPQALSNFLNGRRPSHPDIGGSCKVLARFTPATN